MSLTYTIERGLDGRWYCIFRDNVDCEDSTKLLFDWFGECLVRHFGGYENALELT